MRPLWKLPVYAALTCVTACSHSDARARCAEGMTTSANVLLEHAISKLVLQSQSRTLPAGTIRYQSLDDFFQRNTDCCFVTKPTGYAGAGFSLPIDDAVEIAIRYRRMEDGPQPYAIRTIAIAPCPANMEESEQRMGRSQYENSHYWRWGWRIR